MAPPGSFRPPIRVLVVDDSVVARRLVARALESDPSLEVSGVASNGRIALAKLTHDRPDVVVLDLMMPVMDGFETLRSIRADHPELPVIIFSHLTHDGAEATLDALTLGADGFVLKPSARDAGRNGQGLAELVPLIKALARRPVPAASPQPLSHVRATGMDAVSAVVVAVSTGGPTALATIVASLPATLPVPVLIVQHMPPVFTASLADRLDGLGAVAVSEARDGQVVSAGQVYVAPGGMHLRLDRSGEDVVVALSDAPPENSCRPSADVLFRDAVDVYGSGVLGVVLTGMGRDGLRGAEAVKQAGGAVVVESPETAVIASMPKAVADAGLADEIVPLDLIATTLVRRLRKGR